MRINWILMTHFASREKEFFPATPPGGLDGLKVLIHLSIYPTHTSIGQLRKTRSLAPKIPSSQTHPLRHSYLPAGIRDSPKISEKIYDWLCDFQKKLLDGPATICIMMRI